MIGLSRDGKRIDATITHRELLLNNTANLQSILNYLCQIAVEK